MGSHAIMPYLTVEECVRQNAYRHESNGLNWIELGYDDRAAGSFRKAIICHRRADLFALPVDPIFQVAYAMTRRAVEDNLFATIDWMLCREERNP